MSSIYLSHYTNLIVAIVFLIVFIIFFKNNKIISVIFLLVGAYLIYPFVFSNTLQLKLDTYQSFKGKKPEDIKQINVRNFKRNGVKKITSLKQKTEIFNYLKNSKSKFFINKEGKELNNYEIEIISKDEQLNYYFFILEREKIIFVKMVLKDNYNVENIVDLTNYSPLVQAFRMCRQE